MRSLRDDVNILDSVDPNMVAEDIIDELQDIKLNINATLDSVEIIVQNAYDVLKDLNSTSLLDLDDIIGDLDEVRSSLY